MSVGQRKKNLSPWQDSKLWQKQTPSGCSTHLSYGELMESEAITNPYTKKVCRKYSNANEF